MNRYKYIFVVLVYKNTDVLTTFFESLTHVKDYKVVLVNAYYDDITKFECQRIAKEQNADFVEIPNLGYGGGNNEGIRYVYEHYDFEYLIVSNSDIIIQHFEELNGYERYVVAPDTRMITGKKQNPNMPFYAFGVCYFFLKLGYKLNCFPFCRIAHAINRINSFWFSVYSKIIKKENYNIYSAHGSFFIVGKVALDTLSPLFDPDMFLYNEELFMAAKCLKNDIIIKYLPQQIRVTHLEGASAGANYRKQFEMYKQSFLILDKKLSGNV